MHEEHAIRRGPGTRTGFAQDKAEAFFERHGGWIITVARFVEVLRQVNGLVAGISGMRWRRFLVFNALGAALWVGTWVSLGPYSVATRGNIEVTLMIDGMPLVPADTTAGYE